MCYVFYFFLFFCSILTFFILSVCLPLFSFVTICFSVVNYTTANAWRKTQANTLIYQKALSNPRQGNHNQPCSQFPPPLYCPHPSFLSTETRENLCLVITALLCMYVTTRAIWHMLCISTSKRMLSTLFAGRNHLFLFNFVKFKTKLRKITFFPGVDQLLGVNQHLRDLNAGRPPFMTCFFVIFAFF